MGQSFSRLTPTRYSMRALCSVCLLVLLAVLAAKAQDYPYPTTIPILSEFPSGVIGNNTFYSQRRDYFELKNIRNPLTVSISYGSGDNFPANVCFNSHQQELPIPGTNLEINCPSGAFGVISNNTMPNGSELPDEADDSTSNTANVQLWVKPGANAGFVVTLPDATATQNFTVWFSGEQCEDNNLFPVGSNGQCIPIDDINMTDKQMVSVGAGAWKYLRLTTPAFDSTVANNFTVSVNGTDNDISLYIQQGYIPTQEWFLNTDNNMDEDDVTQASVLTPGGNNMGEVYYIGLYNSGEQTYQVSVNTSVGVCNSTSFGYLCMNTFDDQTTPLDGVRPIPATLTPSLNNTININNGSSLHYDFSDDSYEHRYAYFELKDYPDYPRPYVLRVSVGNNDVSSLDGAPSVFAKLGSYPSAQSNHYNASTVGDVVHQLILPVNDAVYSGGPNDTPVPWYIAVELPVDFAIWVGPNCADDCDNQAHGVCDCNSFSCPTITANNTQYFYSAFYVTPQTLEDSGGACNCDDQRYAFSFDCSQKNNGNAALYILLIAIGGALVLCVAIIVPVYCGIANKKANSYDKI